MNVKFVTSVAPIVRDVDSARSFYRNALGLSFEGEEGDYAFTHQLEGVKHFGLWPLPQAAKCCFGTDEWPTDTPVPQASIEFEVDDVAAAAAELAAAIAAATANVCIVTTAEHHVDCAPAAIS